MATTGKSCDLCAGRRFEVICERDRRGKPLNTVVCLGCGLVGHQAVPTDEELTEYYTHQYRKHYHNEVAPSTRRIWRAWLKGERVVGQLKPYLKAGASVFEIGAGIGCTVKAFEMAGFAASGIEPTVGFRRFGSEQLGADLKPGILAEYESAARFDLVLYVHVIEHVRSPREELKTIHGLLKPGGRLYLECPSLGKLNGDVNEHFHLAHIHTFTPIPLLTLLRQCGFAVEKTFCDGAGTNHKYLLRKVEPAAVAIDPAGLAQTREYLVRFRKPWHRFGYGYLRQRVRRYTIYLQEYLLGERAVRTILATASKAAA